MGGYSDYSKSKVAAPTGHGLNISKITYGKDGAMEGTYSNEIAMSLIFFKEIQMLSATGKVPTFDMGLITEVLTKGQYKVKSQLTNSVVTATSTKDATQVGFSWSTYAPSYKKGDLILMLVTSSAPTNPSAGILKYTIVAKKTGSAYEKLGNSYNV